MKKIVIGIGLALAFNLPVLASSMPVAEIEQKVGLGLGPSFAADFKLNNRSSLGFSISTPVAYAGFSMGRYDVRFLYKFIDENRLSLSGLIGLAGNMLFQEIHLSNFANIEAGIALSYEFTDKLTGRVNFVGGVPIVGSGLWSYIAPSSGAELGYKFTPNIEGTIGGNGQGDFLGLNIRF